MIKRLKSLTLGFLIGLNIIAGVGMLLVGFADYVPPTTFPLVSCLGLLLPFFILANLLFLVLWIIIKWRMAIIPILSFIASYVPIRIYAPINIPQETPLGTIKVMSYNVGGYAAGKKGKEKDEATDSIINYIRANKPDILCIQEDNVGSRTYIHERIDSMFAYSEHVKYDSEKGNSQAVFSRFPILSKEHIEYESAGNASYAYFLDINGKKVLLINNHLESNHFSPDDKLRYKEMLKEGLNGDIEKDTIKKESRLIMSKLSEAAVLRKPQADAVHEYIKGHRQMPTIVCGDFNDNPISYSRRVIAKGLTDCYVSTGLGLGLSYNQKGFFVRIDNILCSSHFIPYNCKVDDSIDTSDHYPIICHLKFGYKP